MAFNMDFEFSPITDLKGDFVPNKNLHFIYGDAFEGFLKSKPLILSNYLKLLKTYFPDFRKLVYITYRTYLLGLPDGVPDGFSYIPDNIRVLRVLNCLPIKNYNFVYMENYNHIHRKPNMFNIYLNFLDKYQWDKGLSDSIIDLEPPIRNYKIELKIINI